MYEVMQLPKQIGLVDPLLRADQRRQVMSEVAFLPLYQSVVAHRHRNLTKQQRVVAMIATPTEPLELVHQRLRVLA